MQQFYFCEWLDFSGYVFNPWCGGGRDFYGNVASWQPVLHNSDNRWM